MRNKGFKIFIVTIAIVVSIFFIAPLFWMLATSFKTDQEAFTSGIKWIPEVFTLENYTYSLSGGSDTPVFTWMSNSLFVGIAGTLIVLIVDTLAAYGLARLDVPFKKLLFAMFIGSLTIPWVITFLPLYMGFNQLGLLDTYAVLILPYSANAFGVFLYINPSRLSRRNWRRQPIWMERTNGRCSPRLPYHLHAPLFGHWRFSPSCRFTTISFGHC